MIAVEKSHLEVVNAMMEKDSDLVSMQTGSGLTVIHWVLEKGHRSALFKVHSLFTFFINPKAVCNLCSQHTAIASSSYVTWAVNFVNWFVKNELFFATSLLTTRRLP